jgi:hypothetical protein
MPFRKIAACLAFVLTASAADAADCQLKQLASLDAIMTDDGVIVPVTLEGRTGGYMELGLSNGVSVVTEQTARSLDLRRQAVSQNVFITIAGEQVHQKAEAKLQLGGSTGDSYFGIVSALPSADPRVTGILAMDVLNQFDIELDLGHNKINLFSPDHCKGQVIYWTKTAAVAAVPMTLRGSMEFAVPMQLDGKDINVELSTNAQAMLNGDVAHGKFGLENANGEHTFDVLAVDGLGITHPKLGIYRDDSGGCNGSAHAKGNSLLSEPAVGMTERCYGRPDLMLSYAQLKHLRVFMAYRERMMYATAAGAN